MVGAGDAVFFEDRIGLRIFLRERIAVDAVVLEELLDFHVRWRSAIDFNRQLRNGEMDLVRSSFGLRH